MKYKKIIALLICNIRIFSMDLWLAKEKPIINVSETLNRFENQNSSPIIAARDFFQATQNQLKNSERSSCSIYQEIDLDQSNRVVFTQYLTDQFKNIQISFNNTLGPIFNIQTIQSCFNLFDLRTPTKTELDHLVQRTVYKLQHYFFDKQGKYVGLKLSDIKTVQNILKDFEQKATTLLQNISLGKVPTYVIDTDFKEPKHIQDNAFNKDLLKLIAFCKQGDFNNALKILEEYRQKESNAADRFAHEWREQWDDAREIMEKLYESEYSKEYNAFGIKNNLAKSPNAINYLQDTGTGYRSELPNELVNNKLETESQQVSELLRYHGITENPSKKVLEIAYDLISLRNNHTDLVQYLANNLSADHPDQQVREAYEIFYTQQGLPKLILLTSLELKNITIPESIGNANHAQDRISLFKLATTNNSNNQTYKVIHKAIDYIIESCKEEDGWQSYSNLARDVADALRYIDSNKAILSTGNYAAYYKDLTLKNKVVPLVASISDRLWFDRPLSSSDIEFYQSSLKVVDTFWQGLTERNNENCATALAWILEDRDNALERSHELAAAAYDQKQTKIEECYTIDSYDVADIAHELQHFSMLVDMRSEFLEQLADNPIDYVEAAKIEKKYNLSASCEKFLDEHSINKELFKTCNGTELQQKLHNEFVNIAHISQNYHAKSETQNLTTHAAHLAEVGCGYNHHNQLQKSITIANTCWALLDCAVGIAEGIGKGFQNVGNLIVHPIDSLSNIASSIEIFGRCVSKTLEMCYLTEAIQQNRDKNGVYTSRLHEIESQLNSISLAIERQLSNLTVRDIARETTTFVSEALLTKKLFTELGSFIDFTKKGIESSKQLATTVPKLTGTTAEGTNLELSFAEKAGEHLFSNMKKSLEKSVETIVSSKTIASKTERLKYFQKIEDAFKKGGEKALRSFIDNPIAILKEGNSIKEFTSKTIGKKWSHIFSKSHVDEGIMKLGETKAYIVESIVDIIIKIDNKNLFKIGENSIKTIINGEQTLVKVFISSTGELIGLDAYTLSYKNPRMLGNIINWI